jgi:hypothetical protein
VVENKYAGKSADIEERKRKADKARSDAIEAAKLAQQQAIESGQEQWSNPKQRQRKR